MIMYDSYCETNAFMPLILSISEILPQYLIPKHLDCVVKKIIQFK